MHSILQQILYIVTTTLQEYNTILKRAKEVGGDTISVVIQKERKGYEGVNCDNSERLICTSKESKQKGGSDRGVWEGCACSIFTSFSYTAI